MTSLAEGTPPSDNDPYSTDEKPGYHIDRTDFPRPLPIFGPLLGYDDKFFARVTRLKIERSSAVIKRPLTSDEANAMAYWGAKQIAILSYSTPVGVAGGLWRWWTTFDKFRFPFWGPNLETFNPHEFPNRMPLLKGPRAPAAWHLMRALFYAGFGKFVAGLFFGSYAMSVAAVGELGDNRLQDVRNAFQRAGKAQLESRGRSGGNRVPSTAGSSSTQSDDDTSPSETPYDDASPSGGVYFDEVKEEGKPSAYQQGGVAERAQPSSQYQSRGWSQPEQERSEDKNSPFMVFDEDSPTGGQGMMDSISRSPGSPTPSGSAWERIRSGQKPIPNQRSSPTQHNQQSVRARPNRRQNEGFGGASADDGFTASASQESRRYSKEEAQREFDAKVERERRGGDFASGSGDQKRW